MENQHINESILSEEILEDQKKNRIDHMTYLPGMEDIGSEVLDQVVEAMQAYDYDKYTAADVKRAICTHIQNTRRFCGAFITCGTSVYRRNCTGSTKTRHADILETVCICLRRFILQIIARIIVFTVDSTVTIKLIVRS